MRDPKWIGTSPSGIYWSQDGKYLLFNWNPEKGESDSLYYITPVDLRPVKTDFRFRDAVISHETINYDKDRTTFVYVRDGDIYYVNTRSGLTRRIMKTVDGEGNPYFSFGDSRVIYSRDQNLFSWDIASGETEQLTNFQKGEAPASDSKMAGRRRGQAGTGEEKKSMDPQQKWLEHDQLELFDVLRQRKERHDLADSMAKLSPKEKSLRAIYTSDKNLFNLHVSPDGRFITYELYKSPSDGQNQNTIVPNYVTQSGFTQDIPGREKVGHPPRAFEFFIFDRMKDTVIAVSTGQLPGIYDKPDYAKFYPAPDSATKNKARGVVVFGPQWSPEGRHAIVDIYSQDNKDRWLMLFEPETGKLKLLDRQRDEAWIGGPGVQSDLGWLDENTFWFQSEASGYSHLYSVNVLSGEKKQLTNGNYEVQRAELSKDKKYFYITTNQENAGEQQFYRLPVTGGRAEKITTMTGANEVTISPDEKLIAIRYSYSNKPWELYIQENKPGSRARQVTMLGSSDEFKSYPWRDPEIIRFKARDGVMVPARLFLPAVQNPTKPAVIFVHGAGYLQNVHKWWSYYYHEFMFNNLLVDHGYTVLDIDYRGSAGYGRDWRTAIYRHMGGKDLDDQVDGAKYLAEKYGINPAHVGIYGGSYGGFITLMAMFTTPGVFAAGAGLRSVTDWAHYNHGYTSEILNEPFDDSLAYKQSSPIYFAAGLRGHLLMCHGVVDENVHFQDIVRLTQRLIELGKDNWELAIYPVEDHGFVEASSWTDEYNRIFKLFETVLDQR